MKLSKRSILVFTIVGLVLATTAFAFSPQVMAALKAVSLKGSRPSVELQADRAEKLGLSPLPNDERIHLAIWGGEFFPIRETDYLTTHNVSYPFALPSTVKFADDLARQYHRACGDRLTVTSVTRPLDEQPRNASPKSVHPMGMAVDLRVSKDRECRSWLESKLMLAEQQGAVEATRERWPPHYHIAVFPNQYEEFSKEGWDKELEFDTYTVRPGDSLWGIARRYNTSSESLKSVNSITGNTLQPGQVLKVPSKG